MSDTIYALASAPGRAGVAVFRVSGPHAGKLVESLTRRPRPAPRVASLRRLMSGDGVEFDSALVLWFPAPGSFTGEDVAEFHLHGGRAVARAFVEALSAFEDLRPAGPGEFSRRAVENGQLDLTRAEAIADLVDAQTPGQARQALRQFDGALAARIEDWRARLIAAAAWIEAEIDFSDEELPPETSARGRVTAAEILKEIQSFMDDSSRGELIREGLDLTVIGPPNAGKSSFLNALARADLAIVSPEAGTTRDVIEATLDLGGYAVRVADTAGLRDTSGGIEAEGIRRATVRAEKADIVILILDGSASEPFAGVPGTLIHRADLLLWNKSDLDWPAKRDGVQLSLKTGDGVDAAIAALIETVRHKLEGGDAGDALLTRPRHRKALKDAILALERGLQTDVKDSELLAEDVRLALRAIGHITGRVDVEELLDTVFRDFCIGK